MPFSKPWLATETEFSKVLAAHQGRLRAFLLTLVFDPHLADDLLQETNEILWRKAPQFELGTNFKAWSFRIASLRVKMQRRRAGRERLVFDDALLDRLEAEATRDEDPYGGRRERLAHCLRRLNGGQRRLVLDRYFRSRSVTEIADEVGQTPNAVSQALFRARRKLMDCVNHGGAARLEGPDA